ncbi:expressed unknown protein [Seminavis robusta]|uniref:Uncharacterized protein n=1 Tax=Seminavis robusta TaxID=568900 RepID=A0A9N8DUT9_9STRA|nr:expressed unknown protein [Seminavis robusta]|eukprot:Sro358_g125910.1 n/a (666) ;mRNA; r:42927-45016
MNARGIAQEVVSWYFQHQDPHNPHASNVDKYLRRPVLSLTRGVLLGLDNAEVPCSTGSISASQEEKKCMDGSNSNNNNKLLDQSSWHLSMDHKESRDVYDSLARRDKARMEAFLKSVEISVPSDVERSSSHAPTRATSPSSSVSSASSNHNNNEEQPQQQPPKEISSPVLTSLNHHGQALLRSVSSGVDSNSLRKKPQPQIREHGLLIRLELYIRTLYRVRSLERECVLSVEPDRAIRARAGMIVSSFVSTIGCVQSLSPVLTTLLVTLTKELLAVEFVGEDLHRVIRRIVNEYEHSTSFASLAFLSSPEASAETRLTPMVTNYIRYLQSEWKVHEAGCELERMLASSLDGNMRRYLKTVEFLSIGHLLEVCQGFRNDLQNIELAPSHANDSLCNNPDAVRQAIMDLQREIITINGHVLPPVTSRKDLISLLSQSLNSRTLTATPPSNTHTKKQTSKAIDYEEEEEEAEPSEDAGCFEDRPSFISIEPDNNNNKFKNRRASFHLSTVDLLTRRLLIAASRTGTGGDAYFIVRDLFGDEDVEVVPAKVLPHHVRASRVGSIEIQVRLGSVTIKCHGSFDIYPKALVGCCEPLIQLHTTSSETIYLQELRSCDSSSEGGCLEDDGSRSSDGMEKLVLQEKKTHKTGHRFLSIRPALYERVEVWQTLS